MNSFVKNIKINYDKNKYLQVEDKYFCYFVSFNKKIPDQGWKIHISLQKKDYENVIKKVSNYCFINKIDFKFLKNIKNLNFINSKNASFFNFGKAITIYCENLEKFKKYLNELSLILYKFEGPTIYSDKKFYKSNVVFYRYGTNNPKNKFFIDEKGNKYKDRQKIHFWLPPFIEDPFKEYNNFDNNDLIFKDKYEILYKIYSNPAGSVFLGRIKNNINKYITIKQTGSFSVENSDGEELLELRKNEILILEKLNEKKINVPKLIDYFFYKNNFFIIKEFINGKDLNFYLQDKNIYDFNNKNNFFIFFKSFLTKILETISLIHSENIVLNDLKFSNFLISQNNIFFIDFDYSFFSKNNAIFLKSDFLKIHFLKNISFYEKDYIKLGFTLLMFFNLSNFSKKSIKEYNFIYEILFFYKICKFYELPIIFFESIIYLLFNEKNKVFKILSENNLNNKKFNSKFLFNKKDILLKTQKIIKKEKNFSKKTFNYKKNELYFSCILMQKIDSNYYYEIIEEINLINFKNLYKYNNSNLLIYTSFFINSYKFTKNKNFIYKANKIIEFLIEKRSIFFTNLFYLKNKKYNSPHFIDGTLGLAFLLNNILDFRKLNKKESEIFKNVIFRCQSCLFKKITFFHGQSACGFFLLKLYEKTKNIDYLISSINFVELIIVNYEHNNKKFVDPNFNLEKEGNFEYGNSGIIFFLEYFIKIYKKNKIRQSLEENKINDKYSIKNLIKMSNFLKKMKDKF